jgi:hypothetical protein
MKLPRLCVCVYVCVCVCLRKHTPLWNTLYRVDFMWHFLQIRILKISETNSCISWISDNDSVLVSIQCTGVWWGIAVTSL